MKTFCETTECRLRRNEDSVDRLAVLVGNFVSSADKKINNLSDRVDGVRDEVKNAREEFMTIQKENKAFRFVDGRECMQYLPLLFDGRTGNNGWCPLVIEDHNGQERHLVVMSIPALVRFFSEECPHKMDPATTTSMFTGPIFPRASGLNYGDMIEALLLAGFAFLGVGPKWNQNRKANMARFTFIEASWFKAFLADIYKYFPERPRVRNFNKGEKLPNYRLDGHDFAFRQQSRSNYSTGHIVQIQQSIELSFKVRMSVQGEAWWKESYEKVSDVCDIPEDEVGKYHVVAGVVDKSCDDVVSHGQAIQYYRKRKNHQEAKKRARKKPKH